MGNMKQGPISEGGTAFDPNQSTTNLVNEAGADALNTAGTDALGAAGGDAIKTLPNSGTFTDNMKQAFTPGGKTFGQGVSDAFMPKGPTAIDVLSSQNINPMMASQTQLEAAKLIAKEAAPSLVAKYAPTIAAGTLAAAGAGAFKTPEQDNPDQVRRDADGNIITGESLIAGDPSNYLIGDLGNRRLNPNTGQYEDVAAPAINNSPYTIPTNYRFNNPYGGGTQVGGPFLRPQMMAADGGEVYPRRNGGIMPDEGIPNQDSVRAMLMPGEFVMTTDAVKGLGNGNMNQGINNMYSVMRGLENRGRTTA